MEKTDTVVAVFADHLAAEAAVKQLASSGFEMKNLSVVGKGYHSAQPSPHSACERSLPNSPLLTSSSANRCISGSSRCCGMFGISS